jgi:hypothetical protein
MHHPALDSEASLRGTEEKMRIRRHSNQIAVLAHVQCIAIRAASPSVIKYSKLRITEIFSTGQMHSLRCYSARFGVNNL